MTELEPCGPSCSIMSLKRTSITAETRLTFFCSNLSRLEDDALLMYVFSYAWIRALSLLRIRIDFTLSMLKFRPLIFLRRLRLLNRYPSACQEAARTWNRSTYFSLFWVAPTLAALHSASTPISRKRFSSLATSSAFSESSYMLKSARTCE